jgi:hypothetical protein
MKCLLTLPAIFTLGLSSCDTMSGPINGGDFDPLRAPGRGSRAGAATSAPFTAGQFVRAAIDNTAFFKNRPSGDADADQVLPRGTSMKVISISGSYVKTELDSGEVGFVPAVMLENPTNSPDLPTALPSEYQVYPLLPNGESTAPLPVIDPSGLPPEGSIPQVIDPEAPTPNSSPSATTPVPSDSSLPLPPNGKE